MIPSTTGPTKVIPTTIGPTKVIPTTTSNSAEHSPEGNCQDLCERSTMFLFGACKGEGGGRGGGRGKGGREGGEDGRGGYCLESNNIKRMGHCPYI